MWPPHAGKTMVARPIVLSPTRRSPAVFTSDPASTAASMAEVLQARADLSPDALAFSFLIDGEGVLRREWRKVKVPGHADEVLAAAQAL